MRCLQITENGFIAKQLSEFVRKKNRKTKQNKAKVYAKTAWL